MCLLRLRGVRTPELLYRVSYQNPILSRSQLTALFSTYFNQATSGAHCRISWGFPLVFGLMVRAGFIRAGFIKAAVLYTYAWPYLWKELVVFGWSPCPILLRSKAPAIVRNLIQPSKAYSCLGFRKLFNVLLSRVGQESSWPMRNIERFPSKQMYLYLSLVERKVAEFYQNIDIWFG